MSPELWLKVSEVFEGALEREEPERQTYLEACPDPQVRRCVEDLLEQYEREDSFLTPPLVLLAPLLQARVEQQRFGPYRLVRELGRGGMGTVYLAERADDHYRKQVAIKLIDPGSPDGSLNRCFLIERQILADLDHPNIARLLDGGTTADGRPYLVMDYIEGEPINTFCQNRCLSLRGRLELFRQVLAAVQYAHRHLIVHRDLKPSNILVSADGVPTLLDFGIAKLLDSSQVEGEPTAALRLMTPSYASPEQLLGKKISTASDVYSLGVLLYELLSDRRPYLLKHSTTAEILRIVCEQEVAKPSEVVADTALRRTLAGDIDNIVLMAMRKEPDRRYRSVEQFDEDIDRYLRGLPVIACKATPGYRMSKFVQRHRVGVSGVILAVTALAGSTVFTAWQASIAHHERARTERVLAGVAQLSDSFLSEVNESIAQLPGSTPVRSLLLAQSLKFLDGLSREIDGNPHLLREQATAYQKIGDLQGNPYAPNLGNSTGAVGSYHKALALRERLAKRYPEDERTRTELATGYDQMGVALLESGRVTEALTYHRRALAIRRALQHSATSNPEQSKALRVSYTRTGDALHQSGDLKGALAHYREALTLALTAPRSQLILQIKLGNVLGNPYLGANLGNYPAALKSYLQAQVIARQLQAARPQDARARRDLMVSDNNVADLLSHQGDLGAAQALYRKSLASARALVALDPHNATARYDLGISHSRLGDISRKARQYQAALANYRQALTLDEALLRSDRDNARYRLTVADVAFRLGKTHADLTAQAGGRRHWPLALGWYRRSHTLLVDLQRRRILDANAGIAPADVLQEIAKGRAALRKSSGAR